MTVGGIVLAGGRSRRMGTAKAGLDWHGVPLVAHVAARVAEATQGPVVVVRAPGQALPPLPQTIVADPVAGLGPLQGLAAGLAALDAAAAFVCATDQPDAWQVIPYMLAVFQPGDDAVAFADQPLGALYSARVTAVAEQRLAAGEDLSLRGLLSAVNTRVLAGNAPTSLRSIDTPEDYEAAIRPSTPSR